VGTLCLASSTPAPAVLLLHGFTGTRDELASEAVPGGVFAETAALLASANMSSLRIDFRGSGESLADLSFADTTFEGQISDAAVALEYLNGLDSTTQSMVIGWSQGGLVAASLAGRGADLGAVALWNAVADPAATFGALFGAETLAAAIAEAPETAIDVSLPWGVSLTLNEAFFDGVAALDPVAEIASYGGALFVANGTGDTLVLPETGADFIAAHSGAQKQYTAEMDHVFDIFAGREDFEALVAETIAFFTDI